MVRGTSERFSKKEHIGIHPLCFMNESSPQACWNLIGRITAKSLKAQFYQELHCVEQELKQALFVLRIFVIEPCQIPPDHLFPVFVTERMSNTPFGLPQKPLRMQPKQIRIHRTVVDHQIHHHLETQFFCGLNHILYLFLRFFLAFSVD